MLKRMIQVVIVCIIFLGLFSATYNSVQSPSNKITENLCPLVMTKTVPDLKMWEWGQIDKPDDKIFDFEVITNVSGDFNSDIAVVSEDGNLYLFDGITGNTIWMVHLVDSRLPSWYFDRYIFDGKATLTSGDIDLDGIPEIIVSGLEFLASINSENGEIEWQKLTRGGFGVALLDSSASGEATDIVIRSSNSLSVFDNSGNLLWEVEIGNYIMDQTILYYDPIVGEFDNIPGEDISVGFRTFNGRTGTLYWESTTFTGLWNELVVGDFNNDSIDDFAGHAYGESSSGLLVMSGNGTELWRYIPSESQLIQLGVGDFNMDDIDDLAAAFWESELRVFNGDGGLLWGPLSVCQSYDLAITDLNNDQIDDIILGGTYGQIEAYEGGLGTSLWSTSVGGIFDSTDLITIADVDGDSVDELFFALKGDESYGQTRRWGDIFALNNTGGSLWSTASVDGYMTSVRQVIPANLTGDGIPDYLVSTAYDLIALEGGTGALLWQADPLSINIVNEIGIADFNNDGIDDLIYSTYDHLYTLYGNNGSLFWEVYLEMFIVCMQIEDFDNDGVEDIIIASRDNGILKCVRGSDGTILWEETGFTTDSTLRTILAANISLDSNFDIVLATYNELQVIDGATRDKLFSMNFMYEIRDIEVKEMTGDARDDVIVSTTNSTAVVNGLGIMVWTSQDLGGFFCVEDFTGDGVPDVSNGKTTLDGQDGSIIHSSLWSGELTTKPIIVNDYSNNGFSNIVVVIGKSLKLIDVHQPDILFTTYSEYFEISNVIRNSTNSLGFIISCGRAIYALPSMSGLVHSLSKPIIAFPAFGDDITGEIFVVWSASNDPLGHEIVYSLYYSPNNGNTWMVISSNIYSTNYQWNTTLYPEGINYKLKVVATCKEGSSAEFISGTFSVSHPAEPEPSTEATTITTETGTSSETQTSIFTLSSTEQTGKPQITPAWTRIVLLSSFALIILYKKFKKTLRQ